MRHMNYVRYLSLLHEVYKYLTSNTAGTPLTLIQGPIQDSMALVQDSKARDALKMASRNVAKLGRLVDSLMDFSKLAANRLEGIILCTRFPMIAHSPSGRFRPIQLGPYTADLASLFRRCGREYSALICL